MAGNLTAMIASIFSGGVTPDPYYPYTTLLLPGNGTNGAQNNTFLDGSTNNFTITRNGNTTQGTFSPFSQTGWGNYFDGNGDYLSSSTGGSLGSGDFTIEFWVYATSWTTFGSCFENSATQYQIGFNGTNQIGFYAGGYIVNSPTNTASLNQWFHVAICRSGSASNNVSLWINGQNRVQGTSNTNFSNDGFRVGLSFDNFGIVGYLSNLRIVKGTAIYSGTTFPPPTSPLTAISGTSLLTCQSNRFIDNSSNNFTITRNGDTRVVAFSPFNPTASWSAATNGGSGYFDGSGDYLTTPTAQTPLTLNTDDFTLECWYYLPAQVQANTSLISSSNSSSITNALLMQLNTTTNAWELFINGTNLLASASGRSATLNTWQHIAITRSGSTFNFYLNGVAATGVSTSSASISVANWLVGYWYLAAHALTGYISNLRIVKGVVVYTGAFTPPTAPITNAGSTSAASYPSTTNVNTSFASSATSLLLNFTNAGIYDATSKNELETVGNAQISTTQSKWGGSSISFDGTGDWLLIPDQPPQRIGTGNFTVEMWVYRNSSGTYGLAGKGTGTTGWLVSLNSSNQVVFTYGSSTITSSGTVSATTWTHIAVVREGTSTNQTKIYINGTNDGTGTVSTDFNQTNSMYIGADRTGGSAANAYVQDVRITNYARYTGNFTAPTAAFPTL